jgi:hypothetical protein
MTHEDEEIAALRRWEQNLTQATENVSKRQYLNALYYLNNASAALVSALSAVLKGSKPTDQREP